MPPKILVPFAALAVTASLGLAACGGDDEKTATAAKQQQHGMTTEHGSGAAKASTAGLATETGASELRAGLTGLLDDHVHLASIAIATGLGEGLDSKAFKASAATLDENSKELAGAIGGVYGQEAGDQFLGLWRKHIGMFVEYAKGVATKDSKLQAKAEKDLDGYRTTFGAFINGANPNLPADAVAEELKPHVASVIAVIDAAAKNSPDTIEKVREASGHMAMTAKVLAGGIATQKAGKFSGSADSPAAELRATLTQGLTDHVYLASETVAAGVGNGLDSKQFKGAAGALDQNSKDLAAAIASVYGDDAGKQFLGLWRKHIVMFVDYTKGVATKDKALARKAQKELEEYGTTFGAFLEGANPNLPADAVAKELKPHVETLSAAIRAAVAGSPKVFDRIKTAANHMPHTAQVLSGGISKQFPDKFGDA